MRIKELTRDEVESVRDWRNRDISAYRTPFLLTYEMQQEFYDKVVCNRDSPHRYFALYDDSKFIGMGGITNIQWENSIGEISLIIHPNYRGQGYGYLCVSDIISYAFGELNLNTVCGEVYKDIGPVEFWVKCDPDFKTDLKNRKYCKGQYHDSMYFSWSRK